MCSPFCLMGQGGAGAAGTSVVLASRDDDDGVARLPVWPVWPCVPSAPVAPVAPVLPVAPVSPFMAALPVAPVAPVLPVAPVSPFITALPGAPVAPVEPAGPAGPGTATTVGAGVTTTGRSQPLESEPRRDCCKNDRIFHANSPLLRHGHRALGDRGRTGLVERNLLKVTGIRELAVPIGTPPRLARSAPIPGRAGTGNRPGHQKQKGLHASVQPLLSIGRGERIRTFDPLHPMQVRYQAALRPDRERNYSRTGGPPTRESRAPRAYSLSSILRMLLSSLRMLAGEMGCGTVIVLSGAWEPVREGTESSRRLLAPLMVKPCS